MKIPALLTSRSIRPKCWMAASTTLTAVSFLLTSPSTRTSSGEGLRSFDLLTVCEEGLGDAQADSAGRAGDDRDGLLRGIHRMSFWLNFCTSITLGNRS